MRSALVLSLVLFSTAAVAAPPSAVVTTVAGTPGVAGYWDGPSTDAMFTHPTWLDVAVGTTDPHSCDEGKTGEIFVVDRINGLVRMPRGIAVAPDGTLHVTDAGNHTVRRITPDGSVTTVAGVPDVPGSDDGPALQAHLNTPSGIDVNDKGEIF